MTRPDFNDLIQQLSRKLYGYAFRILRNQEDAEDVVQEIFIKLWNMKDKLNDVRSIDALAISMTRNFCIDMLRKQKHEYRSDFNLLDNHIMTSSTPHDQMSDKESGLLINRIIEDLPDSYKTVIKMKEIEGFSYEEVAEKTGQNINTLRVNLSRARKLIRDEFNKYQYERRGTKQADRKVL